jgi:hypothetical protein
VSATLGALAAALRTSPAKLATAARVLLAQSAAPPAERAALLGVLAAAVQLDAGAFGTRSARVWRARAQ